jgi:Xaa-Pro dipeptidase
MTFVTPEVNEMAHEATAGGAENVPISEYESRQRAFKDAIDAAGLDAVLLYHQESLYYLYGYDQIGYWVYQTFVVPRSGEPVAICRRADADMIEASPWVRDVRVWMDDSDIDPGQLTAQVVTDLGLMKPSVRIGVERKAHSLLPYYYDLVRERLGPPVELVDASDLVSDLRRSWMRRSRRASPR